MAKLLRIGIVGCGAIGSSLAKTIAKDFSKNAKLSALYDIDKDRSIQLSRRICANNGLSMPDLASLIGKSELIIEASSGKSSWEIVSKALSKKRDIMVMSVGGLLGHAQELNRLAGKFKARVYIPSGAVCGIDALKAACCGKIKMIRLTTRKPPAAFSNVAYIAKKRIQLSAIRKDTVIFEGNASAAIKAFPQNINVAAILSLAGIGCAATRVRIIASPGLNRNIHEIEIDSASGKIFSRTENIIHPDNPKTSFLAVLSAVAVLKQILAPVRVGT